MTKHKSSDERRDQILSAARKCFVEKGYASTSMQDISRTSGLSKGGIYFHFDSKMHVFLSLVDDEYDFSMSFLTEITEGPASVPQKLLVLAQHYLENFAHLQDRAKFFIVMTEVAIREDAVREKLLELQQRYIDVLTTFLEAGMASGEIRKTNPRAVAIFMKALLDGLEGNSVLGYDLDVASLASVGVELLLHGFELDPNAAS